MIRVLGSLACKPHLYPSLIHGVEYLSYDGLWSRSCTEFPKAQDPYQVALALRDLQKTVPLGWLGDYAILCPQKMLQVLDSTGLPAITANGERFPGWIALSGNDYNLTDLLSHEVSHEIEKQFVSPDYETLLQMAGYPMGDPEGPWHQEPEEVAAELVSTALWNQPMDLRMTEAFGLPQNLDAIQEWLLNRIGDQSPNPVTVTEGYRVELTIGSAVAKVNGEERTLDVPAQLKNGRAMVPFRFLGESLGASVQWNDVSKRATYQRGDTTVTVEPGNTLVWLNGQPQFIDVAPYIENGRTLVPLRWISEALGFAVHWDQDSQTIAITK